MRRQSSQYIELSWVKITLTLLLLCILALIGFSIYLYSSIESNRTRDFKFTEARLEEQLSLDQIITLSRYHGTIYYHVAVVKTTEQEQLIVFINQDDPEADLVVFDQEELVTEDEIMTLWRTQTSYQELYHTQYGLRNQTPLLEIVYLDQDKRLSYDYYRLDDGSFDSGISFAHDTY